MAKKKQEDENTVRTTLVISPRDMRKPDENPYTTAARKLTRPEVTAAAVLQPLGGEAHNINALITELSIQVADVNAGDMSRPEAMLVSQSHTLDGLFSNLLRKAISNVNGDYFERGERYMRLAFKAQSQCRTTIETLAEIKNHSPSGICPTSEYFEWSPASKQRRTEFRDEYARAPGGNRKSAKQTFGGATQ